jgi:hypothetical protein
MKAALALSLLVVLTHGVAYGQFAETVEVRVTNVEVIVTDKGGKPVHGLTQTGATNDLDIRADVGNATPAGENLVHPLTIIIPTSTLTLTPEGDDLVGKFSVFTAFLRADGAVSAVGRKTQDFRFPAESLPRRKALTVKVDVTADARVDAISLGVMDDASGATGFALIKLPPAPIKTGSTE